MRDAEGAKIASVGSQRNSGRVTLEDVVNSGKENSGADVVFSIAENEKGKYVKADRTVIHGDNPEKWALQIKDYIDRSIRRGRDVHVITEDVEVRTVYNVGKIKEAQSPSGSKAKQTTFAGGAIASNNSISRNEQKGNPEFGENISNVKEVDRGAVPSIRKGKGLAHKNQPLGYSLSQDNFGVNSYSMQETEKDADDVSLMVSDSGEGSASGRTVGDIVSELEEVGRLLDDESLSDEDRKLQIYFLKLSVRMQKEIRACIIGIKKKPSPCCRGPGSRGPVVCRRVASYIVYAKTAQKSSLNLKMLRKRNNFGGGSGMKM